MARSNIIAVRVTPEELALIERAAEGGVLSAWARAAMIAHARRELGEDVTRQVVAEVALDELRG